MRTSGEPLGRVARVALVLALAMFAPLGASASKQAASPVLMHFGEARALTVDPMRVAVYQTREQAALAREGGFAALGVGAESVRAWPVEGWSLVELSGEARARHRSAEAMVAAFAREPGVSFASPVFVGEDGGPVFPTADLLVGFVEGRTDKAKSGALKRVKATSTREHARTGVTVARVATTNGYDALRAANALARRKDVVFAEPDMVFTGRGGNAPNDPFFSQQWALQNTGQSGGVSGVDVNAMSAWGVTTGEPSVIVVVIDTGVDRAHPDLSVAFGADFTSDGPGNGAPVNQFDNHGTAVAGCVNATINNGVGVAGVAPRVRVASARVFVSVNAQGSWTSQTSWTVNALEWALSIGARVTNNSNSYGFTSAAIATAYANSRDAGVTHFASAGNNGVSTLSYPASLSSVNAVAALLRTGALASFSNRGAGLAFAAPGVSIITTDRVGGAGYVSSDYVSVNGTSFASPYAAGAAALALSVNPSLGATEVELAMQRSATDMGSPGYNTTYGWGLVDAYGAIMEAGSCAVEIVEHPESVSVPSGSDAAFGVSTSGEGATYRWRRNGIDLYDGGNVSGASTRTLTIHDATGADAGVYDVVVSTMCGSTPSEPAGLTIECLGDTNGDYVVDGADVDVVTSQYGMSGQGLSGDVNGDGVVNFDDLAAVLLRVGAGC